ncbi:hypothetical protein [Nocardia sp. NPDC051570]|uniref:hypothetical protein n=1 Tax=Nocardia sp. NPDC051570 TaxID=3364324 RepID=UPI00378C1EB7
MRIRTVAATLGTAVVGGAIAATVTAGPAAAFKPVINDPSGIIVGIGLDHNETVAVAGGPIPELLQRVFPSTQYWVDPHSQLPQDDHYVYADLPAVFTEAARAPRGQIGFALVNPGMYQGHNTIIVQGLG